MLDILNFIFSSPWKFFGALILIWVIGYYGVYVPIYYIACAVTKRDLPEIG